jgi:hypothetical protein
MNPLYGEWVNAIARRDQAMLFIVVSALATIGVWLALRDVRVARRPFVWFALIIFYGSLLAVWLIQ